MIVLSLNSGSSSLKFALYDGETLLANGQIERIGAKTGIFWIKKNEKRLHEEKQSFPNHREALRILFETLEELKMPNPTAVGHRIVHGGITYYKPEIVNDVVLSKLVKLIPYAPLHLPAEIEGIKGVRSHFPHLPQVVCFDTAFHQRMPEIAKRFALPYKYFEQGVRRYGFHGLSYEYILLKLEPKMERIIICHLGNGASAAATIGTKPMDTSMGLTPTGGFMMGTRTGDLDPGILLYFLREKHLSAEEVAKLVDHQSGLLGISGVSNDMKELIDQRKENLRAQLAIDLFCYQLRKTIASFIAVLEGLDILVFTGGIGERGAYVREEICKKLSCFGIDIDPVKNEKNEKDISSAKNKIQIKVVPTNEDLMIARHTQTLLRAS